MRSKLRPRWQKEHPDMRRRANTGHQLAALTALLLLWQLLATVVNRPILPAPQPVLRLLILEFPHTLGRHFAASFMRVSLSITLAVLTAAPLGLILGQSTWLNRYAEPFIYLLMPIPKVVLVPVLLLVLGVGDLAKIIIIAMILFFQILVLVRDTAAGIRPELLTSVRSLGAGRRALFRFVYLPASLPAILTAIRQSIGTAVAVLYIAELFATRYGLGYYIYLQGSTLFDYPRMYAGVLAMSLLGFLLYAGLDLAQRVLPTQSV
jgi:NitT/TauT family transport system permease protein